MTHPPKHRIASDGYFMFPGANVHIVPNDRGTGRRRVTWIKLEDVGGVLYMTVGRPRTKRRKKP